MCIRYEDDEDIAYPKEINFNELLVLEMLESDLWHFCKMSEIHCIKNARNFDLRWGILDRI